MPTSEEVIYRTKLVLRDCILWGAAGMLVGLILVVVFTWLEGFKGMDDVFALVALGGIVGAGLALIKSVIVWVFSD